MILNAAVFVLMGLFFALSLVLLGLCLKTNTYRIGKVVGDIGSFLLYLSLGVTYVLGGILSFKTLVLLLM